MSSPCFRQGTERLGTMAASTKPTLGTSVQAVRRRRSTFRSRTLVAKGLVSKLTRGYLVSKNFSGESDEHLMMGIEIANDTDENQGPMWIDVYKRI